MISQAAGAGRLKTSSRGRASGAGRLKKWIVVARWLRLFIVLAHLGAGRHFCDGFGVARSSSAVTPRAAILGEQRRHSRRKRRSVILHLPDIKGRPSPMTLLLLPQAPLRTSPVSHALARHSCSTRFKRRQSKSRRDETERSSSTTHMFHCAGLESTSSQSWRTFERVAHRL